MTKVTAIAIQIVPGDARPIFRQIVDEIRKEIATGNIPAGAKLPSVRGLAMQLTINANTVAKAYTELTNLGVLESRKGLGVFACEVSQPLSKAEQTEKLAEATQLFVNEVMHLDFTPQQVSDHVLEQLNKLTQRDQNND
ncbi:GntR family transcriptional regulator [Psychrobium sp. MM17-31]|uniref:GntR family transcriptional regulator n=1 Tax=Psychrobium sp. MM17-31 TaxID=2917758 RepID=UPI001EF4931F|nr:GntR family transcriptional regulator [Psychrobium sp. MM17-31]MCG7532862.1 GntR family transcriptional regulator [Psychrobium sp. MM17-31]